MFQSLSSELKDSWARISERRREWLHFYYKRYVGVIERYENYVRSRHHRIRYLSVEDARARRTSDTIFLLGTGPSINRITDAQWAEVRRHDSFAVNLFILHPFVPTFYHSEINLHPWVLRTQIAAFERRRRDYSNTVFFIHHKMRRRGIHPRFTPKFFPENPNVCFFRLPPPLEVPFTRPFTAEDFKDHCIYRGTMNIVFYLVSLLGYRTVVLLGVDLKTQEYFFDDHEDMRWMREGRDYPSLEERRQNRYGYDYMPHVRRMKHTVVDVYHAVDEFFFKPRGVQLYVGSPESLLYPRIPLYPGFSA